MSTSPARIAANRANAQKSTGPRTEGGKQRISHNALTHGLTAKTICLDEECEIAFFALRRHMLEDLDPKGEIECQLAEQMIAARWRLMRTWETETDLYDQAIASQSNEESSTRRRTLAHESLAQSGKLDLLNRYESRLARDYDRCLRRLTDLQLARRRREEQQRQEERDRMRPKFPLQHTDLLTTDEYIRLQGKEKFVPQNKPNPAAFPPHPVPR